ncbi:MAG: CinA family protein [Marinagarivorans sp.]|nr:CinA family protein [Marinagarivorans sp.]
MLINPQLLELATILGSGLKARKATITTVESCTGGAIAAALTAVSGSSAWFDMGIVSYSNAVKQRILGVPQIQLDAEGAVSEAVVKAMLKGGIYYSGADYAIAITGVAGPDGGTLEKPVGTVWIAVGSESSIQSTCHHFHGGRDAVREQSVVCALKAACRYLKQFT